MEQEEIQAAVKDILTHYLEVQLMRKTPERYEILRTVYEQNRHFTADELYQLLDDHYHVSMVTIYNALDLFVRIGLVVRHTFTSAMSFEKCYGVRDHYHQVCTHCGAVKEIEAPLVSKAIDGTKFPRFHVDHITMSAMGICSKCQQRLNRANKRLEKRKEEKEKEKAKAKANRDNQSNRSNQNSQNKQNKTKI